MAQGLSPNSANILTLTPEATPGTYDASATQRVASMLRLEMQPESAYDQFKPMGFNSRAWNAITRGHSVLSGPVRFDFGQLDYLLQMLCGDPVTTTPDDPDTGLTTRIYEMVDTGSQDRKTMTAHYGMVNQASRMPYALLQALSLAFVRMTDNNEGSATILARRPESDSAPMPSTQNVSGTDISGTATMTGTAATPANLIDNNTGTDTAFDTTETAIFTFGAAQQINGIKVTKGATGGHSTGVLRLEEDLTGDGSFGSVRLLWQITDTDDGSWADGASKYGVFPAGDNRYYRLRYTASSGSLTLSEVELYEDAAGTLSAPTHIPLLPQMWTVRRASTLAGLGAATAISRVNGLTLDLPDLLNILWFFDENDLDFDEFVQGEGEVTASLVLANDIDGVVADLVEKSEQEPATPEWWRFRAVHPDGEYSLSIDGYWSCEGNIPYRVENNVRFREFPMSAILNDEGFVLRFTLVTPTP